MQAVLWATFEGALPSASLAFASSSLALRNGGTEIGDHPWSILSWVPVQRHYEVLTNMLAVYSHWVVRWVVKLNLSDLLNKPLTFTSVSPQKPFTPLLIKKRIVKKLAQLGMFANTWMDKQNTQYSVLIRNEVRCVITSMNLRDILSR